MITLTPAYGRDYKNKKTVIADFESDKDFIISSFMHPYDGKPCNKSDLIAAGETAVNIRYKALRMIATIKIKASQGPI